jgi:hypothetical protein
MKAKLITPKGAEALLSALNNLGYTEKKKPKPKKLKVEKLEKKPKKLEKKPKKRVSVKVQALNLNGMAGLFITGEEESVSLAKKASSGLNLTKFSHYYVKVTPLIAPKLIRAIDKKALNPKNTKTIKTLLEQFRRIKYAMRKIDPDTVKELRILLKKYMRTKFFYMFPVLLGNSLEVWVPNVNPEGTRKYRSKLLQLRFEERNSLIRLFPQKATFMSVASQLVKRLKEKKIEISNKEELKTGIKKLKKSLR